MSHFISVVSLVLVVLQVITACSWAPVYGVDDVDSKNAIDRANRIGELRVKRQYSDLVLQLESDSLYFGKDPYSSVRILNELADVYTYQVLDLDKAIEIDTQLQQQQGSDVVLAKGINPRARVANNTVLGASAYVDEFINLNVDSIREKARERLRRNTALLDGRRPEFQTSYTIERLNTHLLSVTRDLDSAISGGAQFEQLLSRLVRAEYEIHKFKPLTLQFPRRISSRQFAIEQFDFTEIDFLQLSDYLLLAYRQTDDVIFAELALKAIYKPYLNIRDQRNRWTYNKIINNVISVLMRANYEKGRQEDVLYYANLNKSRLLLEERARYDAGLQGANKSIRELAGELGLALDEIGLPSKERFFARIRAIDSLVDFYLDGDYESVSTISTPDYAGISGSSRDFGLSDQAQASEQFVETALFTSIVKNGKVVFQDQVVGGDLESFRQEMFKSYSALANNEAVERGAYLSSLSTWLGDDTETFIVTDKWLSLQPMGFHLNKSTVRAVNAFSLSSEREVNQFNITGFFDPTLNLPGARRESTILEALFPDIRKYIGEQATKAALSTPSESNILHLSMHGWFNPDDPGNSKLFFHQSLNNTDQDDPNALYVKNIGRHPLLRDNDLVFAAACQTGITEQSTDNAGEILGMLRPLVLQKNKNVILSLWNVDDNATAFFVEAFYTQLSNNQDLVTAFFAAQSATREAFVHPYYWAAFYLSSNKL